MSRIPSDTQLRARVKLFGNVLGNVLRPLQDGRVLEAVEALRKGYIRLHKKDSPASRHRLEKIIESLDAETLTHVVRAFSIYFSWSTWPRNPSSTRPVAAQVHRGGPLWKGSFDATLREFHDQGISAAELQTLLDKAAYIPVFTAHPTESQAPHHHGTPAPHLPHRRSGWTIRAPARNNARS